MRGGDNNGHFPDVDAIGCDTQILVAEAGEIIEALEAHRQQGIALTESLARVRRQIAGYLAHIDALLAEWGSSPAA